jgi:cell wall-associated NlpC family hydrolase
MIRKTKKTNGTNSNPVRTVSPVTTEPASLRSEMISHIALLMAIVMSAMGLVTLTSTAAHAVAPTVKIQTADRVQSADRAATPGELAVRSLAATKNENKRLIKINRVAGKKAEVRIVRNKLVSFARKQIGDPYRAGRSGPDAFDCSGLVRYVYKQITGKTLPHYSKAQYKQTRKIKKSKAQPGDLVFFFQRGAHHVGIYIGNGKMIDAPNAGKHVRVSPITGSWWGRSYTGMGRLLPA